jgi:DNA (cytosine-5)-methyltransferase 1
MSLKQPTPAEIRAAREAAGLTQSEAAGLVHAASYRTWQNWEAAESEPGHRQMGLAEWDLFLRLTAKQRAK